LPWAGRFLHQPDLLLLDEPFTGLDERSVSLLQQVLRETLERKGTIILSSHQIPEVMALATKVIRLDRGRLQMIAQLWRIARKDLHSELRTKEALNAALSSDRRLAAAVQLRV
jgi:ABC-type multidrug transport system ATPase subunit